jgi:hypothetical protein
MGNPSLPGCATRCSLFSFQGADPPHERSETGTENDGENKDEREDPEVGQAGCERTVGQDLTRVARVRVMHHAA